MKRISACDRTVPFREAGVLVAAAAMVVFTAMIMLAVGAFAAKKKPNLAEIVEKAREAVSLKNAPPFEMRADLKAAAPHRMVKGTYLLDFAAPDQFREEIHLPGYDEVDVASGATLYRKRNVDYTPLDIFCLEELMHPSRAIAQFQRDAGVSADFGESANGAGQKSAGYFYHLPDLGKNCVNGGPEDSVCFGRGEQPSSISLKTITENGKIQYGNYSTVGPVMVARKRQYYNGGRLLVEVDVKKITTAPKFSADAFAPPVSAEKLAWCEDEQPVQRLPFEGALPVEVKGFATPEVLDAFVGADGIGKRMVIIATGGKPEDALMQKIVNGIRFKPATCDGRPVASETAVLIRPLDITVSEYASEFHFPQAGEKGYTRPSCKHCPGPSYSWDAFQAKIQGGVILGIVIETDGRAHDIRVLKHLGFGLDQQAVNEIRNVWRFQPALGPDGKPAEVRMLLEVDFHLY